MAQDRVTVVLYKASVWKIQYIFRLNNYFSSLITPGESCINISQAAALDEVSLITLYRQLHNNHFKYSVKYIDVSSRFYLSPAHLSTEMPTKFQDVNI